MTVYPVNSKEVVSSICCKIVDDIVKDKIQPNSIWAKSFMRGECNVRFALSHYFDITSAPSRDLLKLIMDSCSSKEHKQRLRQILDDPKQYTQWLSSSLRTLKTTLDEFSSAVISARLLFNELPPMQPRQYSISVIKSSKRFKTEIVVIQHKFSLININSPSAIELAAKAAGAVSTFNPVTSTTSGRSVVLAEKSPSDKSANSKVLGGNSSAIHGQGSTLFGQFDCQYNGLCSTYLINLPINEHVICEFVENPRFTLKGNRERPTIMLGQDTGLLAFRTFWQQRNLEFDRAQIFYTMFKDLSPKHFGDMMIIIVTGGKTRLEELFKREIAKMVSNKVISQSLYVSKQSLLLYALSAVTGQTNQIVEPNIQKELDHLGLNLAKMLIEKNGTLYTCCDEAISEAIEKLTIDSIVKHHNYTKERANALVQKMKGKAHKDVMNTKFLFQLQNSHEKSQYIQEVYEI